jgi:hypothetical protein
MSKQQDTIEWIKVGLIAYLGWQGIKLFEGVKNTVTDNPEDAGSSDDLPAPDANRLTYDAATYSFLADQIQSAIWHEGLFAYSEDDEAIRLALLTMFTNEDVIELTRVYGTRGAKDALSATYNLPVSIRNFLDDDDREKVNEVYQQRGITILWI